MWGSCATIRCGLNAFLSTHKIPKNATCTINWLAIMHSDIQMSPRAYLVLSDTKLKIKCRLLKLVQHWSSTISWSVHPSWCSACVSIPMLPKPLTGKVSSLAGWRCRSRTPTRTTSGACGCTVKFTVLRKKKKKKSKNALDGMFIERRFQRNQLQHFWLYYF